MYRRRSKRAQRVRFILTYTLVPLLIVGIVTLLVFMIQGYRFDADDNRVFRAGLVQFGTTPGGATVSVDGARLEGKTRTRINVSSGVRSIEMIREGYVPWQKTVTVEPGSVLWLTYARLIPTDATAEKLYSYDGAADTLVNKNQRLYGLHLSESSPSLIAIEADDGSHQQSTSTLPQSIYTSSANQVFTPTEWSESGRYVIFRHDVGAKRDWLVLDRSDPDKSINLSRESGPVISSAVFDPSDDRYVYVTADKTLYRYDMIQGLTTEALADDVVGISPSARGTILVTSRLAGGKTGLSYVTRGANKSRSILLEGIDNARSAAVVTYDYHQYVSILSGENMFIAKTSIGSSDDDGDLQLEPTISLKVPKSMTSVESSPNGRFIVARGSQGLYVYDLELAQLNKVGLESMTGELKWIDDFHLLDRIDGKIVVLEFDGANSTPIVDVASSYSSVLTSSGRYMYTLQKDDAGYHVVRVRMIL